MICKQRLVAFSLVSTLLAAAACRMQIDPPAMLPGVAPDVAWRRVLEECVDDGGFVSVRAIEREGSYLDTFVAWVAQTDPTTLSGKDTSRAEQLAFHLNAFIALSIYDPLRHKQRQGIRLYCVAGRWLSLREYEDAVIRPYGDVRACFALNCPFDHGPRLPRQPFAGPDLDAQLDAILRDFCEERRNVEVNASGKQARMSRLFRKYGAEVLAVAPSIAEFCNRYRSLPLPRDCLLEFDERVQYGPYLRVKL